ncbi:IclR family transcriptional regulator [Mycolicibacterium agri]|uniref:Glycerol operon regulatory protein n=1 Tax=Mycolicibacterium agri TaxID=36811 RepID=A0A2A7MNC1_MYCAG|nr:IclR family transcriptional regulator [Mycolicibacterium agri]PEG33176.1 IclR family transcriptional regulator [Mycolicibacterium agri]GFG55194.1 IclR family transcriptional regulator [Mycolicibacterium agri]
MNSQASNGVQAVERAFDILEIMAAVGVPIGLSEVAAEAGLPVPTIHRLISTMAKMGYVRQLPNKQYALGPKLIRLGQSASQQFGPSSRNQLGALVDEIGETANMAVLDIDRAVYVAQVTSAHTMRTFIEVGRRVHLHCTGVGKALLLQIPENAVRSLISRTGLPAFTDRSLTDVDALNADLERSRLRGFAIDDGEQEVGVRCFAVPVPGAPLPTAISVSGPAIRLGLDAADRIAPIMQRVAKELGAAFQGGPNR